MLPPSCILPADPQKLPEVIAFVADHADEAGLDASKIKGLSLAVEEAFINICNHAFPSGEGKVEISCCSMKDSYIIEIRDGGPAFDPLSLPAPDTDAGIEERDIGGLGILFINYFTDRAEYFRKETENVLRLTLFRASKKKEGPEG